MTQPNESDDFMRALQHYFSTLSPAEQSAIMSVLERNQTVRYGTHHLSRGSTGHVRVTNSTVYSPVIGVNTGVVVSFGQTAETAARPRPVGLPRTRHPIGYTAIHQALHATWAEVCHAKTPTWAVLTGARGMGRLPVALALGRTAVADGGQMIALSFAPDATLPSLDPAYAAAIRTQWPQNTEVLGDPWLQLIAQQWDSFAAIPPTTTNWALDGAGSLRDVLYAENRPLVLILDGWEYAPEPWITLLRGLPSRGHASYPLLLIATLTMTTPWETMTEESHPAAMAIRGQSRYPVVVHSCHGVSQTDIAMALGIEPEGELAAILHQWSGGHPGMMEYLWDDWCAQGWVAPHQQQWRLIKPIEAPHTYRTRMETLIDARLANSEQLLIHGESVAVLDGATLHRALGIAALEGFVWTAQVVAYASGCDVDVLMDTIDHCLDETTTEVALIEDQGFLEAADETTVNRYQFANRMLWFAYQQSDPCNAAEQMMEQSAVAEALETVYGGMYDDIAEQILFLYESAGQHARAKPYYLRRMYRPTALLPLLWQLDAVTPPTTNHEIREYYRLLLECGRLYYKQGQYPQAKQMLEHFFDASYPRMTIEDIDGLNLAGLTNLAEGCYQRAEQLCHHAVRVSDAVFGMLHPHTALGMHNLAMVWTQQGRYGEAQRLYEQALAIFEQVLGADHPDTATTVGALASVLERQGQYRAAQGLLERALAIFEQVLGAEHPGTATTLGALAWVLESQGMYGEAKPLYERALTIHEAVLGTDHPDTAMSVTALASILERQGRYGEAQRLYERALAIFEQVLGVDHPDTATTVGSLAMILERQGQYRAAQGLLERALAIFEQVLGAEHPETVTCLYNLGSVLESQGRYGEAQPWLERALAVREAILGADHPATAGSMGALAIVLMRQGRYGEAQPWLERALEICEQMLGADHPETARSVHNLAVALARQGRYGEAQPLYERALAMREAVLGVDHPETARSVGALASVFMDQGRFVEAQRLYERSLGMTEAVLGVDHPETARSVNNLAVVLERQGWYAEAQRLYERSLGMTEAVLGADHPETARSVNGLASVLVRQGRYAESQSLYERALVVRESRLGADHPDTQQTRQHLAAVRAAMTVSDQL